MKRLERPRQDSNLRARYTIPASDGGVTRRPLPVHKPGPSCDRPLHYYGGITETGGPDSPIPTPLTVVAVLAVLESAVKLVATIGVSHLALPRHRRSQ